MAQKKLMAAIIVTAILGIAGIIMAAILPPIINKKMVDQAADEATLTPDHKKNFESIPGKLDIVLYRDYYLYNIDLDTPLDLFSLGPEKIPVKQVGPYSYYERLENLNIAWSDDDKKVSMQPYQYYVKTEDSADDSEMVTNINIGAYGVWYQLQHLANYKLAQTVLYTTYGVLYNSLWVDGATLGAYNAGMNQTDPKATEAFIKKELFNDEFLPEFQDQIYNDPRFGMVTLQTLSNWVGAYMQFPDAGVAAEIQDYFLLTSDEMGTIMAGIEPFVKAGLGAVENTYGCTDAACLAAVQWANQGVTLHPPSPAIRPMESVIEFNKTSKVAPEMGFYQNNVFIPALPKSERSDYEKLTWDSDLTKTLLDFDFAAPVQTKTTLFNLGNMEFLFETCQPLTDKSDITDFAPIADRFKLPTNYHAKLLWNYIKYLMNAIGLGLSPEDPVPTYEEATLLKGKAGVVQIGAQALYQTVAGFQEAIPAFVNTLTLEVILAQQIKSFNSAPEDACVGVMMKTIPQADSSKITAMCNGNVLGWHQGLDVVGNYTNYIIACQDPESAPATYMFDHVFSDNKGTAGIQYDSVCGYKIPAADIDADLDSNVMFETEMFDESLDTDSLDYPVMRDLLSEAFGQISKTYGCTNPRGCSANDLTILQWGSCGATLNLHKIIPSLPSTPYAKDLISAIPGIIGYCEWQYAFVPDVKDREIFDLETASKVMSWLGLYSESTIGDMILTGGNPLKLKKPELMVEYVKYLVTDVFLGTFVQTRPAVEWIFGYDDPVLGQLAKQNPLAGGDPSLDPFLSFETNMTSPKEAEDLLPTITYTGKGDSSLVGEYVEFLGSEFIAQPGLVYTGFGEPTEGLINPWGSEVKLHGTDGTHFQCNLKSDEKIYVFVDDLYRQGYGLYDEEDTFHGLNVLKYELAKELLSTSKYNQEVYYDLIYPGMGNQTSVFQAPIFVSKPYFFQATEAGQNTTTTSHHGDLLEAKSSDESWFFVEPYSGSTVHANELLQGNMQLTPGYIVEDSPTGFAPLFTLHRYGGLSAHEIHSKFGPLMEGEEAKRLIPLICYPVGAFFLVVAIVCTVIYIRRRKAAKRAESGAYHNIQTP